MMFKYLFGNSLWVRPIVMMLALGSLTVQSVHAQSSSTWFGIVDLLADNVSQSGRPAGGGGDGGNIIVFDIVDSVSKSKARPAGGGGGGDILVWDIVDSIVVSRVMLLGESAVPGVYEVLVDSGDSIEFGLIWEEEPRQAISAIRLTIMF